MIFKWRVLNEDYEGRSDDSSLEVKDDRVVATCNGESEEYSLVKGETVLRDDLQLRWPVDPTDKVVVDELTQKVFGRRLA